LERAHENGPAVLAAHVDITDLGRDELGTSAEGVVGEAQQRGVPQVNRPLARGAEHAGERGKISPATWSCTLPFSRCIRFSASFTYSASVELPRPAARGSTAR